VYGAGALISTVSYTSPSMSVLLKEHGLGPGLAHGMSNLFWQLFHDSILLVVVVEGSISTRARENMLLF